MICSSIDFMSDSVGQEMFHFSGELLSRSGHQDGHAACDAVLAAGFVCRRPPCLLEVVCARNVRNGAWNCIGAGHAFSKSVCP